jgi:hypothetical protein
LRIDGNQAQPFGLLSARAAAARGSHLHRSATCRARFKHAIDPMFRATSSQCCRAPLLAEGDRFYQQIIIRCRQLTR